MFEFLKPKKKEEEVRAEAYKEARDDLKRELLLEIEEEQLRKKQEEERIRAEAEKEAQRKKEIEEEAKKQREEELKQSDEPWVDVKGIVQDPTKGIKVELDWNDAFIDYLKQNGFSGADDEQIVQKYIALIYKQMVETMDEESVSEYE